MKFVCVDTVANCEKYEITFFEAHKHKCHRKLSLPIPEMLEAAYTQQASAKSSKEMRTLRLEPIQNILLSFRTVYLGLNYPL